jgi:hypothetical protein
MMRQRNSTRTKTTTVVNSCFAIHLHKTGCITDSDSSNFCFLLFRFLVVVFALIMLIIAILSRGTDTLRFFSAVLSSASDKGVKSLSLSLSSFCTEVLVFVELVEFEFVNRCNSATYAEVRPPTVTHLIVAGSPDGFRG